MSPLLTDLVSYWKLDEVSGSRADAHGSNTLTDNNTVGSAAGIISNAASFVAASSEYLSDTSVTPSISTVLYSVSAWVYPSSLTGRFTVFQIRNSGGERDGGLIEIGNGSGVAGSVSVNVNAFWVTTSASVLTANAWNHIVVTIGGTGTTDRKIYVNGVDVTASPSGTLTGQTCDQLYIGARNGASNFYGGRIDEVGVWNRVLTSAEVTQLYNGGAALAYPFSSSTTIKTVDGVTRANVKTFLGVASASIKTINGIT